MAAGIQGKALSHEDVKETAQTVFSNFEKALLIAVNAMYAVK